MTVELICGDCLDILPDAIPDGSVNLVFVDPPYNIGIFCKMDPAEYLEWCEQWIALVSRKLAANGAFWVSHKNPRVLGQLADMIEAHGRGLVNWVTWDKLNGNPTIQAQGGPMIGPTMGEGLRSFQVMAEYLIYHAGTQFLSDELKKARLAKGMSTTELAEHFKTAPGRVNHGGCVTNWELGYNLPTEEQLATLVDVLGLECSGRYTFNNPGKVSSVWQIPPAPRNGHATPKPEALLERIILATSNPGDVVLDPMFGSGTAGAVAARLKRSFVGCEVQPRYYKFAKSRIEQAQLEVVQGTFDV